VRRAAALLLALLLPLAAAHAQQPSALYVGVRGEVARSGSMAVTRGTRLAQVALAVGVKPDAYALGAAYMTPSRVRAQTELKAGLAFDLTVLADAARLRADTQLSALVARWQAWLKAMPVTGRRPSLVLDPRRLELAHVNPLLQDGAILYYPPRPNNVRVVGAVRAPCVRAFVPMRDARAYLRGCARAAGAEPDWMVVIEPDGQVTRRGIGAWNRQPPIPLAPGAMIYVPLGHAALKAMRDEDFNRDMASFLATQLLPETAP